MHLVRRFAVVATILPDLVHRQRMHLPGKIAGRPADPDSLGQSRPDAALASPFREGVQAVQRICPRPGHMAGIGGERDGFGVACGDKAPGGEQEEREPGK